MIFFLNPDQGSPFILEGKCRKVKFRGSQKIMKVPVVKRHTVESLTPEKEFGHTINANVQKKKTKRRRTRKNRRKSEMKRNPKKKWVKMKMKRNKKGGLE